MTLLLVLLAAYLLGSLVFGILYSRLRGADVRGKDFPGGSGIYRQYGLGAALVVTACDMLKGALAVYLAQRYAPGWEWAATFLVIAGHCYPAFFGFNGGGGIAPFLGAIALAAPRTLGLMVVLSLIVMPTYKFTLQKRLGLNVIPFMSLVVLPCGLLASYWLGGLGAVAAGGVGMALRSVQWLLQGEWKPPATKG